jgi:DNA polymerase alpha subunit A
MLSKNPGLDPTQYQVFVAAENEERPFETLESQIPDKERFKDSEPFTVRCPRCEASTSFSRFGEIGVLFYFVRS